MSMKLKSPARILLAVAFLALAGCASGSLMIVDPPTQKQTASTVRVVRADSNVAVDKEVLDRFESDFRKYLYEGGRMTEGDELTASYRFIQLSKGNKAARYFIGFGAGKGTLTIEVAFRSRDGAELGKVNVGGEISGGWFGGAFKEAVDKAAQEAATFAINSFAAPA